MYVKKDSFLDLSKELDFFINKFYRHSFLKGLLMSFVFIIFLLSGVLILEEAFRFSSAGRGVLLVGGSLVALIYFFKVVVLPLMKLFSLVDRMSYIDASYLLSEKIPEIGDQLINVIGLKSMEEKEGSDLLLASVEQKSKKSLNYDLSSAISLVEQKKFLFIVFVVFVVSSFCSLAFPDNIIPPLKRVILFQNSFEKPNPFYFEINKGNPIIVLENNSVSIDIKTIGKSDPEQILLYVEGQRFFPLKKAIKSFKYKFNVVKKSFTFKLLDGNNDTISFPVTVSPRPRLLSEKKIIAYPSHTGLVNDTFYNINRVIAPEGSVINWVLGCRNVSSCTVIFNDTVIKNNEELIKFSYTPKKSQDYLVYIKNDLSNFIDSSIYYIELDKDAYPSISVDEFYDSTDLKKRFFLGDISDDYGFTDLRFVCKIKDSILVSLPVNFQGTNRAVFSFDFDFSSLNLSGGDLLKYYFLVKDNDGVNNPKMTASKTLFFKTPSKKELKEIKKTKSLEQSKAFSSLQKKLFSFNDDLDKLRSKMLNKKSLDWEDKLALEDFLKLQKKIQEDLEKLQNILENELSESQKNKNSEILKKQQQVNKMMQEIMSDEMKKLYDELGKLAEEMNKEKVLKKLEDLDFSQDDMLKDLDRTIEHFKKLELEQKAAEIAEELQDLAKKQDELKEKNKDKEFSGFEKNKGQERIKEAFNEIQNDLYEMKMKNKELEKPLDINTEEKEKEINESMNESLKKIAENKNKKLSEQQEKSSEGLKDLADSMESISKGGGNKVEEDMESLRTLLEHLITFSLDQELVLVDLKKTNPRDPKFIEIGQDQRSLNEKIKVIEDSLTALSLRQIMLSNKINSEVKNIKRSLKKSIRFITERKSKNAQIQQQTVMMHANELGLLLSEMMSQLQQNMPGSGQCNKPGGKNKNSGKGLPENAEQLKKQIEAMKKFIKGNKGGKTPGNKSSSFEQLGRMAAEQSAIKKQLLEMAQELNKDGSGKGNSLNQLVKKIEDVESDIINNNVSLSSIKRQEEIKIKLLELDKANKEENEEEKREAQESLDDYKKNNSGLFEEYLQIKQGETELLKTIPPNLKPYYKNKVNEYFKSIDINYD